MRVQRTRSSASPPRSPLTRHPLGGFRLQSLALAVVLAAFQPPLSGQEVNVESGTLCAFRGVGRYAFWASDRDSHQDLGPVLLALIRKTVPGAAVVPADDALHVSIQYSSSLSSCTHCDPPFKGPRFVFAMAQVRTECDIRAQVTWIVTTGGSVDGLASEFAEQLAAWYRGDPACDQ
jgi:hypothetical protein